MPAPFASLTTADLAVLLDRFPFRRRITSVHMHHTWRPDQRQYRGHDTIVGMWTFHTQQRGFIDIAQHLSIAPDGTLWTGRDWNLPPASASGHNGNAVSGPFMFEIIGDFDAGRDQMPAEQKTAVLDVITLVQKRFQITPETLLFHNMLSAKSCPGTSVDRTTWLEEVRQHSPSGATGQPRAKPSAPFQSREPLVNDVVRRALECLTAPLPAGTRSIDPENAELDYLDEPIARSRAGVVVERGTDRLSPEELDALRPHVINLRQGVFSTSGQMTTTLGDVDALFDEHLEDWISGRDKARIVIFAHGGLVSESSGLAIARKHVDWWRRNSVYPIYFVWETGLFETIGQLLERTRTRSQPTAPGERGVFSDWISDPIIEEAVRALQAHRIWGGMKHSARLASEAPLGGAHEVAARLAALGERHKDRIELHAVGHSAGSIFHAHFLPACAIRKVRFKSLQLLAPAVTTTLFRDQVVGLTGTGKAIEAVTLYTMRRAFEEADHCAKIYRKSLLYLVSEACETERKTPILGLEKSLRADAALEQFFALGHHRPTGNEVIWSKSPLDTGRSASHATSHGGFDDDAPTMNSVLRRILGLADADEIDHPYPRTRAPGLDRPWTDEVDWPAVLDEAPRISTTATAAPQAAIPPAVAPTVDRRRKAVCIGINRYAAAPLNGCVKDAGDWARVLRERGFDVTLLTDREATRDAMLTTLESLIRNSRAGDILVFQYAGHGTQLEDLDGDEAGGDTPGQDEALCPVDYDSGAYLIDDDIANAVAALPEGVSLTFLLDCCHSGTGSRFAARAGATAQPAGTDVRARFLPATPGMQAAHREFRERFGRRALVSTRAGVTMREVTFAACQSHEVAFEVDGQGEFTRHAVGLLTTTQRPLSNAEFYERVLAAFGPGARQRPHLDCDVLARTAAFLALEA